MENLIQNDFVTLTGAGVRIGIIDSGFDKARYNSQIVEGCNFSKSSVNEDDDYSDLIGHGTACVGLISSKVPQSELYPVKIFDYELAVDIDTLIQAITWCVEQKLHVINLSLGTTDIADRGRLQDACDYAYENNVFIVAATSNEGRESYPALLPNVFGVNAGKIRSKYAYYFDKKCPIQCIARGDRQRLGWLDNKQVFMGGTSFACPHIAAIIAIFVEQFSGIRFQELCELLEKYSLSEQPPLVDGQEYYDFNHSLSVKEQVNVKLSNVHAQGNIEWIKKAVIFPYNKEMHSLVRFRDLLPFQITHVVDVISKRTIGKDAGEVIGAERANLVIQKDFESCLSDSDTVILGYLDEISRIKKRDVLEEVLQTVLKHRKNVYSLTPLTNKKYPELLAEFENFDLHIGSPVVEFKDFEILSKSFDYREKSQKPIVGVFGTSPQQGKFTTQLALRQALQKVGYKVGQLGTEHQSTLFGFDFTFPNGYDGYQNVQIPMDLHIPLLQRVMVGIEREDPHIIVVGGQSGLIPYNYAEKSSAYTLPSLILLMGIIPDAYILVVNSIDEHAFIRETMQALEAIGKGKTILLVFSDKKKIVTNRLGVSQVVSQPLSDLEIKGTESRLEAEFDLPATEVISARGRKKMVSVVEDFFEAK